jgi:hypothetical protein
MWPSFVSPNNNVILPRLRLACNYFAAECVIASCGAGFSSYKTHITLVGCVARERREAAIEKQHTQREEESARRPRAGYYMCGAQAAGSMRASGYGREQETPRVAH